MEKIAKKGTQERASFTETSYTKDPRRAKQFLTIKAAAQAAREIGWRPSDARPVDVMGFRLAVVMDECQRMLTPDGYSSLLAATQSARARAAISKAEGRES